jgi:hypothetical protein
MADDEEIRNPLIERENVEPSEGSTEVHTIFGDEETSILNIQVNTRCDEVDTLRGHENRS